MPQKPKIIREKDQKQFERLDAFIRRNFVASGMSDSKWIKALRAVSAHAESVPRMNFKLVNAESWKESFNEPEESFVEEEFFREPLFYRELEWVEFPYGDERTNTREAIGRLREALESIGKFPLESTETGLRIVAYVRASRGLISDPN